jgi:aminoglycoside phosphotransferase (APT) family kinase protein
MTERYVASTGRDLSSLRYYEALALFKLAVILEGTYTRERAAGVPDHENSMGALVPRLVRGALEFAHGDRR